MDKFFKPTQKRVESRVGSSSEISTAANKRPRVDVEFNPKDIVVDPGLRKSI